MIATSYLAQQRAALELQREIGKRASLEIVTYIQAIEAKVLALSENKDLHSGIISEQVRVLRTFLAQEPRCYQLSLVDWDGQELVKVSPSGAAAPETLLDQSSSGAFIQARKGEVFIGSLFFSEEGAPSFTLAVPVRTEDRVVIGMLLAEVDFTPPWEMVSAIQVGDSGYVYIVDEAGVIIAYQDLSMVRGERRIDVSQKTGTHQGLEGIAVLGTQTPIQYTSWWVVVELPTNEAFGLAYTIAFQSGLLLLIMTLLASGAGVILSRWLVHPIKALERGAEIIGEGNLDHVIEVKPGDELGALAETFNRMSSKLKRSQAALEEYARTLEQRVIEQERAEQALRESEERYRTLIEQSNDAIYFLFERRFVLINQRFEEMFGVSREEVLSADFDLISLVAPQSRPLIEERNRKVQQGEPVPRRYEFAALTKGGQEIEVEASVSYIPYGGGIGTQGILRDITERKQAEEALRESEKRYRRLIELLPDGVAIYQDDQVCMVNQAAVGLLGYDSPEEVLGQPTLEFASLPNRLAVIERIQAQLASGESVALFEERLLRKDETMIQVEILGGPLVLGGRPAVLVVIHDLTQRRRLEEQLRQAQKMEAVGRLAGGVAHDFNNLLMAIGGYTEFIFGALSLDNPLRKEAEAILKAVQRATQLIRQLLAFSRRQVLEMRVVDLNQVLEGLEGMLRRIIGEDVEMQVLPAPDLWNVRIDPSQMEQVIVNLAVNARDAMPTGGRLILETANVKLDASYSYDHAEVTPGPYVLLAVSDTGRGMPLEIQKHIFEPFFTTKEMGTGLGLATVYGIVKQFGGHIQVYSEVGQGTTFRIYLPFVEEAAEPVVSQLPVEEWPRGSETILVVEDSEMVRNLAVRMLQRQGYTVLEAQQGNEALQIAESHPGPIDLLLTDVVMPQMGGRVLVERLRQFRQDLQVIYMSGYTDTVIAHHGILEPGLILLQKPFTPQLLVQKVRQVLDRPSRKK